MSASASKKPTEQLTDRDLLNIKENLPELPKLPKNFDTIDKLIVAIKRANPSFNVNQIAIEIQKLGFIESRGTTFRRFNKNDFIRRDFAQVEQNLQETLIRKIAPGAQKVLDDVVNKGVVTQKKYNDDGKLVTFKEPVPIKTRIDTAKDVYKQAVGEKQSLGEQGINIGSIKNAQFVIGGQLSKDEPEST